MTNGEKIQKDFKGCEVCEPIVEDDIIHVIFADKKDSAIGFDWSWWNAEYKEPTTKNDLKISCISREQALRELKESAEHHANDSREEVLLRRDRDIIRALPPVTPQEPKWIPVSERLPEEDGGYLVTVKQGYVRTSLWVGNAEYWNEVTAWMPLPKPYREVTE